MINIADIALRKERLSIIQVFWINFVIGNLVSIKSFENPGLTFVILPTISLFFFNFIYVYETIQIITEKKTGILGIIGSLVGGWKYGSFYLEKYDPSLAAMIVLFSILPQVYTFYQLHYANQQLYNVIESQNTTTATQLQDMIRQVKYKVLSFYHFIVYISVGIIGWSLIDNNISNILWNTDIFYSRLFLHILSATIIFTHFKAETFELMIYFSLPILPIIL
jgi:hypothetical protein